LFGARDITPVGYAAFALVLGVTAGLLLRRTVAAMAASLAVLGVVEVAMAVWVRAHLIAPLRSSMPLRTAAIQELEIQGSGTHGMTVVASANQPGAWIVSNQTVTAAGHPFTGPAPAPCLASDNSYQECQRALGSLHLRQLVTYQPASRYWDFQWIETGIFLALALAPGGLCYWLVRRRRLA
jgi:hypothetical protein